MKERDGSLKNIFCSIIEDGPTAILVTRRTGEIEYVNPAFTRLTGYSLDEVRGENPRFLKSGLTSPEVYQTLWKTILSGNVWQGELWNRRKDGDIYAESILISPLRDAAGEITHFVGMWQEVTERKCDEQYLELHSRVLERQSITDDLTGQYNRRHILEELEKELERAKRYGRCLSGMMIDIDDFKRINDQYGHPTGDKVLKTFAAVVKNSIRKIDIVGRYGGDEFIVILPEADLGAAELVAERIQKNLLEYRDTVPADLFSVTASIGLISFDEMKGIDRTTFIEKIDGALLGAKREGKNRIFTLLEKGGGV